MKLYNNLIFSALVVMLVVICCKPEQKKFRNLDEQGYDSTQLFFKSMGVLVYSFPKSKHNQGFEILNPDISSFAIVNISKNVMTIDGTEFNLENYNEDKDRIKKLRFKPKEFYPDYSIYQFEFTANDKNDFEIFIDKETGLKKIIRNDSAEFYVNTWEEFLIGTMISVDRIKVFKEPAMGGSEVIFDKSADVTFVIDQIIGKWVKITCGQVCDQSCPEGEIIEGWVQWRTDTEVLVEFHYSC